MLQQRRIAVVLAYDGGPFHGWQIQPGLETIQGTLERIVSEMEGAHVAVDGSGRTDAGVHAEAQVAAFTIVNPIPVANLQRAMNRLLPASIRVLRTAEVPLRFHPRFDARAKTYEYRLYRAEVCSPFLFPYVHHYPFPLNEGRMVDIAPLFEGEHDWSAFAASDDRDVDRRSAVRQIFQSRMERRGDLLCYRVRGSGFLKHMVRMLVGALIQVGKGNLDVCDVAALLEPGYGRKAAASAPAKGLTLVSVEYEHPF